MAQSERDSRSEFASKPVQRQTESVSFPVELIGAGMQIQRLETLIEPWNIFAKRALNKSPFGSIHVLSVLDGRQEQPIARKVANTYTNHYEQYERGDIVAQLHTQMVYRGYDEEHIVSVVRAKDGFSLIARHNSWSKYGGSYAMADNRGWIMGQKIGDGVPVFDPSIKSPEDISRIDLLLITNPAIEALNRVSDDVRGKYLNKEIWAQVNPRSDHMLP